MAAADSPASASSSTLIVPSEPNLSSDKLAQFESTTIAAGRPRPLGIKMPVPHTRLSGKGFIEPHKSNLPRRTARGRTWTRERDVVPSASEEGASPIPIPAAVRSPPPPPLNLGSPTELGFPNANAKDEDDELPLETAQTTRTEPPTSSMAHLSFAAATAAILSSTAADTSDRPLPHPAMGLTMGLMNAAAAAAAKRTNSPARGGLDVTPGLLSFTSPALGVQGSPIPIPIPTAYPSTPIPIPIPIPTSTTPFTPPIFGTPPLSSSIPQTPPTSSGPQVGNLPRRHRRGRAGLGLGSPVPQERRPGVGAKESLDSELASKEKQDVNVEERRDKEGGPTTALPKTIEGAEGESDLLEPGKILKFVRLPLLPQRLQAHRKRHSRRTSSEEKDERRRAGREMSLPRTGVSAVSESEGGSKERSRSRGVSPAGFGGLRDMSRSPLPIRNVGAGYDEQGPSRNRSLPPSLPTNRKARVRGSASRTREVKLGQGSDLDLDGPVPRLNSDSEREDGERHKMLTSSEKKANVKEEKKRMRDERREKRCLQVIGRSAVEVGFLDEDDVGYELEADTQDEHAEEVDDEETKKRKEDERKACRAGLAGGRVLVRALDVSRTQTRRQGADDVQELELELRLPTDPTRFLEGVPSLTKAQMREGCEFMRRHLHRRDLSSCPPASLSLASESPSRSNKDSDLDDNNGKSPRRIRILTPRWRPEEALALAVCYLAWEESVGDLPSASGTSTSTYTDGSTHSPTTRLVPSTSTSTLSSSASFHTADEDPEEEDENATVRGMGAARLRPRPSKSNPNQRRVLEKKWIVPPGVNDLPDASALASGWGASKLGSGWGSGAGSGLARAVDVDVEVDVMGVDESGEEVVEAKGKVVVEDAGLPDSEMEQRAPKVVSDPADAVQVEDAPNADVSSDAGGLENPQTTTDADAACSRDGVGELRTHAAVSAAEGEGDENESAQAPPIERLSGPDSRLEAYDEIGEVRLVEASADVSRDQVPAALPLATTTGTGTVDESAPARSLEDLLPDRAPALKSTSTRATSEHQEHLPNGTDIDGDVNGQQPSDSQIMDDKAYTLVHLLAMRLLDDDDGGVWLGNVADAKGKAKEASHPLLAVGLGVGVGGVAAKTEVSALLATVVHEEGGERMADAGAGADGGSNEDVDGSESGYGSVGWGERGKAERRGRSRNRRRHVREAAFAGRSFSVEVVRHGADGYEPQEADVVGKMESAGVLDQGEGEEGEAVNEIEEEEEPLEWTGLRMEWRGILSFEGLQALVGVWDD